MQFVAAILVVVAASILLPSSYSHAVASNDVKHWLILVVHASIILYYVGAAIRLYRKEL
ncbi:Uncharacterised protein [Mycobacteroides abscessus subsp. abscessus]|nr:hypothetical protein [Mycobacteroides abscessus]SHU19976.1 Uncharacterised protein [Mycobacteroides abscessus subsp. abscessus]CPT97240.1 Uncharacterised protein [Mycobacteroides abscessus]SHW96981.1 Uncharacterised protein [Mycobacteroides abscessus subsp. abscessus]SHW97237.1 Uncharacterised protein [Mycobacteroides abscessus subsp. abscessus]